MENSDDGENEDENEDEMILESDQIYVLMKKDFRLSRNTRAQWYFNNLNEDIRVSKYESIHDFTGELDVVSVVPKDPDPDWDWDIGHLYKYHVDSTSMVRFLAQRYRLVYLLDLSPSSSGVDLFTNRVSANRLIPALRKSLEGLVRPFYVPGSQLLLKPDIYVTVIAWTPFLTHYTQRVLKQGFLLTSENIDAYIDSIIVNLDKLNERVCLMASVAASNGGRSESSMMERLFQDEEQEEEEEEVQATVPVATPEAGFVNMVRTGILALQLLPKLSSGGIIVITDGVFSVPDMNICDGLLNQLRSTTVTLSFLQVASAYHPHGGYARVPYVELMEFFSCATYGTYLPKVPDVQHESYVYKMNIYHEAFLCWSFRKALEGIKLLLPPKVSEDHNIIRKGVFYQGVKNVFFKNSSEFIIKKKFLEATMFCPLSSLLSVRLREGYTVNGVRILPHSIEVQLTLPWKIGTYIHYTVVSQWPQPVDNNILPPADIFVYVEGCYDVLHDIICQKDKNFVSKDRNDVTRKFYVTLQNLTHVDKLLCHIESFPTDPVHYVIPEAILNGVPLFYIPPNMTTPVFFREEFANTAFGSYWKPINSLDINIWHRWMHTNRIHIMLQHDYPLPRHLFLANTSGRYTSVQCRKAALKLFEMLKNISTFVLMENNSYVQFVKNENDPDGPPISFYVIRITSKPPCVVIWLAFPSGASGTLRHRVQHQLMLKIDELRIKQNFNDLMAQPTEVKGTVLLLKPVERILIRYNKIPQDYFDLFEPAYSTTTVGESHSHGTYLALARYLHHRRWIWCIRYQGGETKDRKFLSSLVSGPVLARILHTLAKTKLLEGFAFAHSHSGIQNLALELPMTPEKKSVQKKSIFTQQCVIQYVMFPPHTAFFPNSHNDDEDDKNKNREENQEDDDDEEEEEAEAEEEQDQEQEETSTGEIQIITEVWVEPQDGVIEDGKEERQYLNGLKYFDLPDAIFRRDQEVISTLVTFEHLQSMCEDMSVQDPSSSSSTSIFDVTGDPYSSIKYIPYSFNLLSILTKSSSVELLLSMLIQNLSDYEMDIPNEKLYEQIMDHLFKIHDREVNLSDKEHSEYFQFLSGSHVFRQKDIEKETETTNKMENVRWRCFVKSVNTNHIIVTMLPQRYTDLRFLQDSVHLVDKAVEKPTPPSAILLDSSQDFFMFEDPDDRGPRMRVKSGSDKIRCSHNNRDRAGSLEAFSGGPPIRDRTRSEASTLRSRTFSMDNKGRASKPPRPLTNSSFLASTPKPIPKPPIWGSLTLPIFMYDVAVSNLVAQLLRSKDASEIVTSVMDMKFDSTTKKDEPILVEKHIRNHCSSLQMAYYKSYVTVLFECLQDAQFGVHVNDIQNAINYCDKESIREYDITDFIEKVCQHHQIRGASRCQSVNHSAIKKKFTDILHTFFKLVPGYRDLYYFSSVPEPTSSMVSRQRSDIVNEAEIEAATTLAKQLVGNKRSNGSLAVLDSSMASLISNHTSSDLNDTHDIDIMSITSNAAIGGVGFIKDEPLFLQISATLMTKEDKVIRSIPLQEFPTCWSEIDNDNDNRVSIKLLCMALPPIMISNGEDEDKGVESTVLPEQDEEALIQLLPEIQKNALAAVVDELLWMIKDEIVYAMTQSPVIDDKVLEVAINHISSSVIKPGCAVQTFPLHFVFQPEDSMQLFLNQFMEMELLGYKIVKEGERFYYVVKKRDDENKDDDADDRDNNNDVVVVEDEIDKPEEDVHPRFQLSPVKEVGSLDDDEESNGSYNDRCKGREGSITMKPTCWLIIGIVKDVITIYFQYREGQLNTVLPWRHTLSSLVMNIKLICKTVNQRMLLKDLNESRQCHRLLEPPEEKETRHVDLKSPSSGTFSCPVVWETRFKLHPRLKPHLDHQVSRGMRAIRLRLSTFHVHNRANMFVYTDERSNIYYMITDEENEEEEYSILLKVHGLCDPGEDIKKDLVSALQHELNEQVVEVISELLQRNPMSKFMPRDVTFLQRPDSSPNSVYTLKIKCWHNVEAVASYLKQNLINFKEKPMFLCPKYASNTHQFQDHGEVDTFIYYKCGKIGRHGGIAVIKVNFHCGYDERHVQTCFQTHFWTEEFERLTETEEILDDKDFSWIRFSIWDQGRLEMEKLKDLLRQSVEQSLWDAYTEYKICSKPFLDPEYYYCTKWMDFGIQMSVSSVSKFCMGRSVRYSSSDILKEIHHSFENQFSDIQCHPFIVQNSLIPCRDHETPNDSIFLLLGRNETKKRSSFYQKFPPSSKGPRETLIMVYVDPNEISLVTYNVSKDVFDRLMKSLSSLMYWFAARSSLMTSIVSQKLGLFHNVKFCRKIEEHHHQLNNKSGPGIQNPFMRNGCLESLIKNRTPSDPTPSSRTFSRMLNIYRDSKPLKPLQHSPYSIEKDPLGRHGRQWLEMKMADKREILYKLYQIWQNRGESKNSALFTPDVLRFFKRTARLVHFCLTPLLFLPHWRAEAHSTRLNMPCPPLKQSLRHLQVAERSQVGLIQNYVQEYIQYLHTLGFLVIHTKNNKTSTTSTNNNNNSNSITTRRQSISTFFQQSSNPSQDDKKDSSLIRIENVYLQKSLPGGMLVFEIGVCQPFFFTRLYALEYGRLQIHSHSRRDANLGASQETLKESFNRSIVDECDHIKYLIHVHSFTYDYHIRTAINFISGRPSNIRKGFHLAFFIDDFIKYYNKAPNFARNMVHAGEMEVKSDLVTPEKLYNYLLSHEKSYDLKVLRMEPPYDDEDFDCEYMLVRQSGSFQEEEDYDLVLLFTMMSNSQESLKLKYYILLTSKRDLYPTYNLDKNKGQFRTVLTRGEKVEADSSLSSSSSSSCSSSIKAVQGHPVSDIQTEEVDYVGYFSSREQSMQRIMDLKVEALEITIEDIFQKAAIHCRRDQLWLRLLSESLQFSEFNELLTLVDIEPLEKINQELAPIVSRSVQWYQSLIKVVMNKYPNNGRLFAEGTVQHLVVQDPAHKCMDTCTLISIDLATGETSLNVIFKERQSLNSIQKVVEDFLSICLYHVWTGLL